MIFFVNAEFLDGPYNLSTVKIVELKRVWYLHILVTKAIDDFREENACHAVGIDRGLHF